jgi:photosynthetic reaction center cytochrome c subunit
VVFSVSLTDVYLLFMRSTKGQHMKPGSRTILYATTFVWMASVALAGGQAVPAEKPLMAEDVFKNIQVLKGIPADEFMGTMSVFSAALGESCETCHDGKDGWASYALDTVPRKRTARRMVTMMAAINQANFGGRQAVTCFTCHRGADRPRITPSLTEVYGEAPPEGPDEGIRPAPDAPSADQVLDKYVQAIGGASRLASLTSFAAKGNSGGYGPEGDKRPVEIFAKAPDQRTTIIHTLDGDSTAIFDGRAGWFAAPHRPVPVLGLTGGELDGARLDAQLSFPAQIKQAFGGWRAGAVTTINDRPAQVLQGTSPGGTLASLYFDRESGLLVRLVRFAPSKVGRLPTQIDYADYRDVAGVKLPFRWTVTWLSGVDTFELTEVRPNVAIEAAKFAKPKPPPA